ncbi:MAG: radical SAM protein [Anaerovoracaceae bacterium]|jgi:radical SAM superfamily enzyme YgiQ (UPF0313 family)
MKENVNRTFHIGPIRPPSEANSLLLQVTSGCTWNRCRFCSLYRHTGFRAYKVEDICRDIDNIADIAEKVARHYDGAWDLAALNYEAGLKRDEEERSCYIMVANWLINGGENVFLQDGNSVVLSGGKLSEILRYLKKRLPTIRRITSYGRAENLSRVPAEAFAELKEAGLDRIHSGFESGSDAVLQRVSKGVTAEQLVRAGTNIRAGGIELSVYFMPGLGGRDLSRENAIGMAQVISACDPDFVRIRTCAIKPGTELYDDWRTGKFPLAGDDDKVKEIRLLIEEARFGGRIVSDHIVNLLQDVQGRCGYGGGDDPGDRTSMLAMIDSYLSMPGVERRVFQLFRRLGRVVRPSDIAFLDEEKVDSIRRKYGKMPQDEWDIKMNGMISRYI